MEEVKQIFRPEFLNRIDETIVFAVLTKEEVKKIAKLFMDELRARLLSEHQITLDVYKRQDHIDRPLDRICASWADRNQYGQRSIIK